MRTANPLDFPAPCSCTDPKGHRADCPSNPGDDYVKFARVVRQNSYPGEDYDVAMSWGLPRNRAERAVMWVAP